MAIGDVRASGGLQTQLISDRSSEINSQAASGLGDAVNRLAQAGFSYLNSKTDIENVYDKRAQASQGLELDTQLLEYQKQRGMEFTEFSRGRSANPAGMTRDYDATLAQREAEFLKTVPPRFQEEVKAKLAQDRLTRVASAFSSELTLLDTVDTNNLNTNLNSLGSAIKGRSVTLADAQGTWEEMVGKTALPAEQKAQFIENGRATLQGLEFGSRVENAAKGFGVVRDGTDGSDVVAAGLLPGERAVLNVISRNEAQSYDVWNGGSKFQGYQDHPAAFGKAPGKSTAAGRYQFILGTWRAATAAYEKKYGVKVPDFSPEWQDRVAANWAENQFNRHYSGKTYREILASGDPRELLIIRDVLGKPRSSNPNDLEWEGLGHMGDAQFIEMMSGEKGYAGGGTGPAGMPNPWTDPDFADVSLEGKMSLSNAAGAAAEASRREMATQIKLERDSFLDAVYNAGYSNQPGVLEALQASKGWDAEAQARYNSGQEVFRATEKNVSTIGRALAEGSPLSPSEIKAFGNWFGEDSFAGLVAGEAAAYAKLKGAVSTARLFPDGSADAFAAAMGNPQTAPKALDFLASALAGDSSILKRSGFSEDMIAQARLYQNVAANAGTPEAAFAQYSKLSRNVDASGRSEAQLSSEASKIFFEEYPTVAEVVDKWDGYFSSRPDTKFNEATESMLMQDAARAYRLGFLSTGTKEGADAYMQTALDNLYGVSQTQRSRSSWGPGDIGAADGGTTSVLMRLPPEKYYPAKDNDFGYLYTAIADQAESLGASRNGAVLIPDDITEKEVRAGKPPTYMVLGVGPLGEAMMLPGRFGGESISEKATETIREETNAANSLDYINRYSVSEADLQAQLEVERGYDRQQSTFGGGSPVQSRVPELEARLAEASQQRQAAVIAALEQGHINPEVAASDANVAEIASSLTTQLRERITADGALSRRVSQAILGNRDADSNKVLSGLIAKELKVPATLADLIALELIGTF